MSLRPSSANWFELLVMRDDLAVAMKVLASSRRVELQSHGEGRAPMLMPECRELLEEFDELERLYRHHWPPPAPHERDDRAEPYNMLQRALDCLRRWATDARDVVERLERLTERCNDQELLLEMLCDAESLPDLAQFSRAGPMLDSALFLLGSGDWPDSTPGTVITQRVAIPTNRFLMAVGLPDEISELEHQLHAQKSRRLVLPKDLPPKAADAEKAMRDRLFETRRQIEGTEQVLRNLHDRYDVDDALAEALFLRWYVNSVPEISATENFAWISGWTSVEDEDELQEMLAEAGVKGLLQLTQAPAGYEAPLLLKNPRWMRPFEIFTEMLGIPAAGEADPTRVVAIATPLMFGYMFGDVGHGAVLLIAGFMLRQRYPVLRLLIYGGAMSIVFGFAFGSVFALESIIEPFWVHPIEEPVLMLLVPMAGGAVLLLIGMCLDALQSAVAVADRRNLVRRRPRARISRTSLTGGRHRRSRIRRVGAAANRQYGLVRAHRRIRARPCRIVHGGRGIVRCCGFDRSYRDRPRARQRVDHRARGSCRFHPDGSTGPVRVLYPVSACRREAVSPPDATDHNSAPETQEATMTKKTAAASIAAFLTIFTAVLATAALILSGTSLAAEATAAVAPEIVSWGLMAAAIAAGLSAVGAAYAVAHVGSAAVGTLAEKPELLGRVLIFVGLAEGIAIYGLIVAILILNRIG
jgi:V/A-type H+-transporting ATPase subunit I